MDRLLVLVLAALLCLAHSTPLQEPVVERSPRRPPREQRHPHQNQDNAEGEGQEHYDGGGSAASTGDREGARRRRLTTTTDTNQQHQSAHDPRLQHQQTKGDAKATTTRTAAAGSAESRPAAAAAAPAGRSDNTVTRSVDEVQGSEAALKGAVRPETGFHGVQVGILEGEGQAVGSDGALEVVEGGRAEEDKGIEEGEAGGFVVVAQDGKPGEGETGDSVDNDNSSTNGISNNIMVIVFCALAFVANGGFLVYVFWVM
eukprot:g8829.t1